MLEMQWSIVATFVEYMDANHGDILPTWNRNVVILTKLSTLAALKVLIFYNLLRNKRRECHSALSIRIML